MAAECEKIKNVCYKLHYSEPSEVVVKFVSGKMEGVWLPLQLSREHPSVVLGIEQDLFSHKKILLMAWLNLPVIKTPHILVIMSYLKNNALNNGK